MGTAIRAEISKKNDYYISKHRYYELKHYCLQYKEWQRNYNDLCISMQPGIVKVSGQRNHDDHVMLYVRQAYLDQMCLIEDVAKMTDETIGEYIFKGVTEGLPYTYFKTVMNIPCCKDTYYELYHKFFYILSKKKR